MENTFIQLSDEVIVNREHIALMRKYPLENGDYTIVITFKDGNDFRLTSNRESSVNILYDFVSKHLFSE